MGEWVGSQPFAYAGLHVAGGTDLEGYLAVAQEGQDPGVGDRSDAVPDSIGAECFDRSPDVVGSVRSE